MTPTATDPPWVVATSRRPLAVSGRFLTGPCRTATNAVKDRGAKCTIDRLRWIREADPLCITLGQQSRIIPMPMARSTYPVLTIRA
jgi:hypothetical protein